jgi:hypothetical protein
MNPARVSVLSGGNDWPEALRTVTRQRCPTVKVPKDIFSKMKLDPN